MPEYQAFLPSLSKNWTSLRRMESSQLCLCKGKEAELWVWLGGGMLSLLYLALVLDATLTLRQEHGAGKEDAESVRQHRKRKSRRHRCIEFRKLGQQGDQRGSIAWRHVWTRQAEDDARPHLP